MDSTFFKPQRHIWLIAKSCDKTGMTSNSPAIAAAAAGPLSSVSRGEEREKEEKEDEDEEVLLFPESGGA